MKDVTTRPDYWWQVWHHANECDPRFIDGRVCAEIKQAIESAGLWHDGWTRDSGTASEVTLSLSDATATEVETELGLWYDFDEDDLGGEYAARKNAERRASA